MDTWTTLVAAYAAIVATGALALEVRRWSESGPRLSISVMPEAITVNMPGTEGKKYVVATVTNRGNAATTITTFGMLYYESWLRRIRSKSSWEGIVASPQPPGHDRIVPKLLQPGQIWQGMALRDHLEGRIGGGLLYVAIYASHSSKPALKRVHIPAKPPEDASKI